MFKFVGKIRLPDKMKWSDKLAIVNEVISELGLEKCQNTGILRILLEKFIHKRITHLRDASPINLNQCALSQTFGEG